MNQYHVNDINTHSIMMDEFLKDLNPPEDFTILEIGCNEGRNLYAVQKQYPNCRIYGTDINTDAIMQARENVPKGAFYVNNIETDTLPFDTSTFDYILFIDVLEHLHDPDKVLTDIKKYLKPDGRIICSIPNLMNWMVMKGIIQYGCFSYQDTGILDRTHLRFFTYNECLKMFQRCKYTIEKTLRVDFVPTKDEDFVFINQLAALGKVDSFEIYRERYNMFEMGFLLKNDQV